MREKEDPMPDPNARGDGEPIYACGRWWKNGKPEPLSELEKGREAARMTRTTSPDQARLDEQKRRSGPTVMAGADL